MYLYSSFAQGTSKKDCMKALECSPPRQEAHMMDYLKEVYHMAMVRPEVILKMPVPNS